MYAVFHSGDKQYKDKPYSGEKIMEKIIHESLQGDYDGECMVNYRALGGNWRMRGRGVTKPVRSRDAARRKRKAARKARSRR